MHGEQFEEFDSTTEGRAEEHRVEAETTKIGNFLTNLFETLPAYMHREDAEQFIQQIRTLAFRSQPQGMVWAERTDYNPAKHNVDTLLRTFRLRLLPSHGALAPEWLINEEVQGDGVKYEPSFLDYGSPNERREGRTEYFAPKDPGAAEMEEALQIMEKCWNLYKEGKDDALLMYSTRLSPSPLRE